MKIIKIIQRAVILLFIFATPYIIGEYVITTQELFIFSMLKYFIGVSILIFLYVIYYVVHGIYNLIYDLIIIGHVDDIETVIRKIKEKK